MTQNRINKIAAKIGMDYLIKYRWVAIILVMAIIFIGYFGSQKIVYNSSNESFLPDGDLLKQKNEEFKDIFGNEEFVFVYIEADNIFEKNVLEYIQQLTDEFESKVPFAKEVTSITNMEFIDTHDDVLDIDDFIPADIPKDKASLDSLKNKATGNRLYVDRIISKDAKKTGIAISFEVLPDDMYLPVDKDFSYMDLYEIAPEDRIYSKDVFTAEQARIDTNLQLVKDPRKIIAPAVYGIMEQHKRDDIKVLATGGPIADSEGEMTSNVEGARFGLIALIVSIVLLAIIFRSVRGVIGPIFVVIATLLVVYGFMGFASMPMSTISMLIAPLILVISVSYAIHIINHFNNSMKQNGNRLDAVRYSYEHSSFPITVAALTTAVGFGSFVVMPMTPIRHVGLACAFGVLVAYFFVMLIMPIMLSFGKNKTISQKQSKHYNGFMTKWADYVAKHSVAISIVFTIITLLSIFYTTKVGLSSDSMEMLGDKLRFVRDTKYIMANLGSFYSYEMMIEFPEPDMAKDPNVLNAIDSVTNYVGNWSFTKQSISLIDVVKEMNHVMNNRQEGTFAIPESKELIAQYLLLYEMSGGEGVEDMVDYDYQKMRISVHVTEASDRLISKFDEMKKDILPLFPPGTNIHIIGDVPIILRLLSMLMKGQVYSIGLALLAITVLMIIVLRSVRVGLLSMLPNVFPVLVVAGFMGAIGIKIDLMTVMIAPMIIGIAVDATVHYFLHFKDAYSRTGDYLEANRITFRQVGYAILFASIVLAVGFAIFGFSRVKSMYLMGIVSFIGIIAALIADLLLTPVLFIHLRPFSKNKK